ncbi:hypothetical protein XH99_21260 [Bradyrhizobium nanningense]|uniref:Uncharacterized protein n=1 Tax=Bradyrhizobium nanningense TaxID=1325118 RepID=A0A4Q0S146_9BRAD|nr:hypothetical protein XH99_21260 [Bradyrhizobium nanningense]RXH29681.1 hypothetical protein XH84_22070 [Bradyrhizobium nanningense]
MLDPLTVRFGRFFASIRDERGNLVFRAKRPSEQQQRNRNELMHKLFGGNIMFNRDQAYVVSDDGRKIPFASLSSGQQELLPLWLSIEFAQEEPRRSMVYIVLAHSKILGRWWTGASCGCRRATAGVLVR